MIISISVNDLNINQAAVKNGIKLNSIVTIKKIRDLPNPGYQIFAKDVRYEGLGDFPLGFTNNLDSLELSRLLPGQGTINGRVVKVDCDPAINGSKAEFHIRVGR